ncbi:MAG: GTP-binding protein [Promethearchaeota archaeon]|nr:MAG: GTP-binding protein [Candidatus Lokiarchaeota archaeon]
MAEIGPLNLLLQHYLDATTGSEAVFIVKRDMGVLTSIIRSEYSEVELGSLTSLISYIADIISIDFQTGYFRKSVQQISTPGKKFVFRQINLDHVLVTICHESANQPVISAYSVYVANKIDRILKGEIVPLEVPRAQEKVKESIKPRREYVFKIVIIGDAGVGKTTTTVQFAHSKFQSEYKPTIGVSIVKNEYWIGEDLVNFQIWDIAGQSFWKDMRRIYYGGAQGCLILYDVTRPGSFNNVHYWKTELQTFIGNEIPCILCANKIDLEEARKVTYEEGEALAATMKIPYIEISAKTSQNIDALFHQVGQQLIVDYERREQ